VVASATIFRALLARNDGSRAALIDLLGEVPNYALTGIIVLGLLLVLAAAWSVHQDRAEMAREEEDVEWVHLHGREGLGLVFAAAAEREALFRGGEREYTAEAGGRVETLMEGRVRRILQKARDPYLRVSPDELRGIAETRTARYGVFARYASSLLLLLAVLGTFAGVKTALPGLIDAVSPTGGAQLGGADIAAPLRAVADAFGGNALALVGAITVGLMAQGLATGRRNLLERLELVSTDVLYGGLHGGGSADPLTEAIRDTGRAIDGLESGMNGLSQSFHQALELLAERLLELTAQQDEALHEKLHEALGSLSGCQAGAERTQAVVTGVDERAAEPIPVRAYAGEGRDPEVSALLRRIAGALEQESGPTWVQLALSQAAGTLAALGLGYGLYVGGRALLALLGWS
jgi:Sec-independent protein translocase protein TatA